MSVNGGLCGYAVNTSPLVSRLPNNFSFLFDLTASSIASIHSLKEYLLGVVKVPMKELLVKRSGKDPGSSLSNPTLFIHFSSEDHLVWLPCKICKRKYDTLSHALASPSYLQSFLKSILGPLLIILEAF